jgi:hypothetical protein
MDRSKFDNQLMQLRKIILDGISYFIAFQALDREYELSNKNADYKEGLWWKYRGFLAPARNALLKSTLVQLSKVYDTDERTTSLRNLVVEARNNSDELTPFATEDSLEIIQVRIVQISELLDKLKIYRNKRLVHLDSTDMENLEISDGDIEVLTDKTKSIFNSFKLLCDGNSDNFDEIMEDVKTHSDQIIEMLSKAELG